MLARRFGSWGARCMQAVLGESPLRTGHAEGATLGMLVRRRLGQEVKEIRRSSPK